MQFFSPDPPTGGFFFCGVSVFRLLFFGARRISAASHAFTICRIILRHSNRLFRQSQTLAGAAWADFWHLPDGLQYHARADYLPPTRANDMSPRLSPQSAFWQSLQWITLILFSILVGGTLVWLGVPAAFFLGAAFCGVIFRLAGVTLKLSRPYFFCAQALVGCAAAKSMTPSVFGALAGNWPVLGAMVLSSVIAGGLVGYFLTRWRVLPGNTAAWGASPGGASAMVALAEAYGADVQMVAMMQYLRVLIVVSLASLAAHQWSAPQSATAQFSPGALFRGDPALDPAQVALTLAIMAVSSVVALYLRVPAGALLVTMVIGATLNAGAWVDFRLPPVFQMLASMAIGGFVGLGFDRKLLYATLRSLHWLFISAFLLIGLCAFFAWALHRFAGSDLLTAYLATTPGGLDAVILLAMDSGENTDVPFVVATQTLRLFVVVLTGPLLARWICRVSGTPEALT